MSKLMNRLLVFFIGVPICVALCFVDFLHFLPIRLICLVFCCIASLEFSNILSKKIKIQNKYFVMCLSFLIILFTCLQDYCSFDSSVLYLTFYFTIFLSFTVEIFSPKSANENFSSSIEKLCSTLLIILYCGLFFSFIVRMTSPLWFSQFAFSKPIMNSLYFTLFLIIVFGTDSFAWFFGMTMGKNNRGYIKASPNKSIAGFVGGILTTILVTILVVRFIPIFSEYFSHISTFEIIFISLLTSIVAIIGDLLESVLKRASGVKDSGNLIPGRGGVLDSIDSILLAAPIYYLLIKIF